MADMRALLAEFGAEPAAVRLLDDETPELLPYATLMAARRNADDELRVVEAVYEWQDAPLVFLINADSVADDRELQRARLLLAMRGDAPYLGVVAPGSLHVYGIALDRKALRRVQVGHWGEDAGARNTAFARLANGRPQAGINNRTWISDVVLRLLNGSMSTIIGLEAIGLEASHEDAISLVGRALFTRFLGDRGCCRSTCRSRRPRRRCSTRPTRPKRHPNGSTTRSTGICCPCRRTSSEGCRRKATGRWATCCDVRRTVSSCSAGRRDGGTWISRTSRSAC